KIALAYRGRHVTYEGLDHLVNQTAHQLLQDGMEKGDMVTVMSKNRLDFVIVKFALARMGAVMIPINYMLSVEDVQYILEHAEVSGLIASEEYAPVLDKAAVRLEIKQRYVMDTVTKPENNDLHEDWRPLGSVRE